MVFDFVPETCCARNCTFCGRSAMVSNYVAGLYVVQICERCVENPPGVVVAEVKAKTQWKKR